MEDCCAAIDLHVRAVIENALSSSGRCLNLLLRFVNIPGAHQPQEQAREVEMEVGEPRSQMA